MKKNTGKRVGSVTNQEKIKQILNNLGGIKITEVVFNNGDVINKDLIVPEKAKKANNRRPEKFLFRFTDKEICRKLKKDVTERNTTVFCFYVSAYLSEISSLSYIDNKLPKPQI